MLLSGRKTRPDNNARQGVNPLDPLRISSVLRCTRTSEILRAPIDHGPAPSGLRSRSPLVVCTVAPCFHGVQNVPSAC